VVIRVFVVDDHEMVRRGIHTMLEGVRDIIVCGEAGTFGEARRCLLLSRPHVALVDVRLPDGSGIELVRDLRSRKSDVRCAILTSIAGDEAFFQAVVAGASGYLLKDVGAGELQASIRALAAGESLIRPETIDNLRRRVDALPPEDELLRDLTGQEQRILRMVTDGMTNREIAGELKLAEKTVRNYVSNILAKVGMRNRTQLAVHVASRRPRP
jgi:two-component system, NarL family, response regulator DevR